jgi:hypothetical protein
MSDLIKAIQRGIEAGQKECEKDYEDKKMFDVQREQKRGGSLVDAYNLASGLISGLKLLKEMPYSTFDFSVGERGDDLYINTNIPVYTGAGAGGQRTLHINVSHYPDGGKYVSMIAHGDQIPLGNTGLCDPSECFMDGHEKILEFVAKKAVIKGLLKL